MVTISNEITTFIELLHEVYPAVPGEAAVTVRAGDQASSLLGQSVDVNLEHNPHQVVPHYQWIRFTITLLDPGASASASASSVDVTNASACVRNVTARAAS